MMQGVNRRLSSLMLLALGVALIAPAALMAQANPQQDEYQDLYGNDGRTRYENDPDRFAIGFGGGIVLPDDGLGNDDGEIYWGANFRFRIGGDRDHRRGRDERPAEGASYEDLEEYNRRHNQEGYRGRDPYRRGGDYSEGIRAYIEPEIGYWKRSETAREDEDLLLGVNLVGVVPTRAADFFVGVGFGLHFADTTVTRDDLVLKEDGERLGGNLQVGVEINLSNSVGIFGTGRIDILEDGPNDRQTKIWGGLRFHF
jgi:hypothetical protein